MESVEVTELGRVNITTLMLKQILDQNLLDPQKNMVMANRILTVQIRVRDMITSLFFEMDRVRAEDGAHRRPDIEITGDMQTLLSLVLGANPLPAIWKRKLSFRPRRWKGWLYALRFLLLIQLSSPPVYLRWLLSSKQAQRS